MEWLDEKIQTMLTISTHRVFGKLSERIHRFLHPNMKVVAPAIDHTRIIRSQTTSRGKDVLSFDLSSDSDDD
jgi:hypothetical protein